MKVYVEDGRVQKVKVDMDAPVIPGAFCVRPLLAKEYQEHPFRLSYPMKRRAERGANQWEQIPWDQALDEIADRLSRIREQYGAEALATQLRHGTGRLGFRQDPLHEPLRKPQSFWRGDHLLWTKKHGRAHHLRRALSAGPKTGKDPPDDPLGPKSP